MFAPLQGDAGDTTRFLSNRLVITLDPEYIEETDRLKMDLIMFVAMAADCWGLFLGLSGVSVVQAVIWSVAALVAYRTRQQFADESI